MKFESLKDALQFAMEKEKNANALYLMFSSKVKDASAKALLGKLADQEMGHWNLIREALQTGSVGKIGKRSPGPDLQVSDWMVEIDFTPDSSPQDIMVFAMQMEQKARDLYGSLLDEYRGTALEALFSRLIQEETRHKEILETEYEAHFSQWM